MRAEQAFHQGWETTWTTLWGRAVVRALLDVKKVNFYTTEVTVISGYFCYKSQTNFTWYNHTETYFSFSSHALQEKHTRFMFFPSEMLDRPRLTFNILGAQIQEWHLASPAGKIKLMDTTDTYNATGQWIGKLGGALFWALCLKRDLCTKTAYQINKGKK